VSGSSLYDYGEALTVAFERIDALLAENDGEFTEAMQAEIDAAEGAFDEKAVRVALYARSCLLDVAAIKAEKKRLSRRQKAMASSRAWLLNKYLPDLMKRHGRTEIRSPLATLRLGEGRAHVVLSVPVEHLPPAWLRTVPAEFQADKKAILEAHKRGEKMPPGVAVERDPVVRVT
jgi:hypothetical protein